jgi:hypothetical protein
MTTKKKTLSNRRNAKQGRGVVVRVGYGSDKRSVLRRVQFDKRSRFGKLYFAHVEVLENHCGNDLSAPQRRLIDQAARLMLLSQLAWEDMQVHGAIKDGDIRPAFAAYVKTAKEEREVLSMLGLKRPVKELTLQDYLAGRAQQQNSLGIIDAAEGVTNDENE